MSLRNVIEGARKSGDLVNINRTVDLHYELANVAHALEGSLALFESIEGYPDWRV
jgi:3-polyprenyl-4-hydroxybenzoate decarboxylase